MRFSLKLLAILMTMVYIVTVLPHEAITQDRGKVVLAYLYQGPNESQEKAYTNFTTQVLATGGVVDMVSPNFFDLLNVNGDIQDRGNQQFIDWAQKQGIKVLPMVSKDYNSDFIKHILADEVKRKKLADDLLALVDKYNVDGLNIDFEGSGLGDAEKVTLTAFMEYLTKGLKERGKLSTMAVMSKVGDKNPSWYSEYDYRALGKICDYIVIMTYDQHWTTSEPGPVAGYDWVEPRVKYAIDAIGKDKVIMGAPLYGRYWRLTADGKRGERSGNGIGYPATFRTIEERNLTVNWDETARTPWVSYEAPIKVGGKEVPGQHTIWFDNYYSLGHKMRLFNQYDVAGAAFWRLGFEDTSWWPNLKLHLNGSIPETDLIQGQVISNPSPKFRDVPKGHWALADIDYLAQKDMVNIYSGDLFAPSENITREDLAQWLVKTLALPEPQSYEGLKDVSANHPKARYIYAAKEAGIIQGYPDGTFKPTNNANRAEIAKMLTIALNLSIPEILAPAQQKPFKDVNSGYWAERHIYTVKKLGLAGGFPDGTYKPKEFTKRAEMASFLRRAIDHRPEVLSGNPKGVN